MSNDSEKNNIDLEQLINEYIGLLSDEHKMLIVLKRQLYSGSWDDMLEDLNNRLEGKPYVFKLVNRINDDIDRIKQMQEFEKNNAVDLADYVKI